MNPLEIANVISSLRAKYQKDAFRIALFEAAVVHKTTELATTNPSDVPTFARASAGLMGDWVNKTMDIAKNPWKYLFSKDPYFDLRKQTRVFAANWTLDAAFVDAMG